MQRLHLAFFLLLSLVAVPLLADEEDLYDVLGLPQKDDATEREIKQQFRKLSKQYHPDVNQDPNAKEVYKKIQRAHEVLSDRRKRKIYDMKGEEGLKQLEERERNPNAGMMDPFAAFFGHRVQDQNKGQNVQLKVSVSLDDVYNGAHHKVTIQKQKLCKRCKGTGAASKDAFTKCNQCGGSGKVRQRHQIMPGFVQEVDGPCPKCGGKGKQVSKICPLCKGKMVTKGDSQLEVEIEQGTPEGHQIVHEMEADQNPDQIPGDVIFIINSNKHHLFTRKGNDLEASMRVSLKQALLGFEATLTHMDGHEVPIKNDGITNWGQRFKISGEGMPVHQVPSEKGDLYVTVYVDMPKKLGPKKRAALAQILGYEVPTLTPTTPAAGSDSEGQEESEEL